MSEADAVGFSWTAKAEGAAGLTAAVTAQARQEVTVDEGVIRTRATLTYDVSRADVSRFVIEVPADHDVVNVFDPNVQRWEKTAADGLQRIDVMLFQPVKGNQNIVLELEKFTGGREMMVAMVQADVDVPAIRAVSAGVDDEQVPVGRQQGIVVVQLAQTLRGDVYERSGLAQIDAAEVGAAPNGAAWDFAYRYATVPYALGVRVEKLLPEITAIENVVVELEPEKIEFTNRLQLLVERAGVFQFELLVPAGFEVDQVTSREDGGYAEVVVESHELKPATVDGGDATLIVQLGRQASGQVALRVTGHRALDDENLRSPTGAGSSLPIAFARLAATGVKSVRGSLTVVAPESLRLSPTSTKGVRSAQEGGATSDAAGRATSGLFSFGRDAVELTYDVSRRKPFVEANQALTVDIESGVAKFESKWLFDIRYSGVEMIRVDVPADLADPAQQHRRHLGGTSHRNLNPDDVAEGYVAWQLTNDDELLGRRHVTFPPGNRNW
ncbi:MAG: hypothetical protein R3B96_24300 [Pirellulaceae bacterium]